MLLGTFYAAMVVAGYAVELLFWVTGLIPAQRSAKVMEAGISWNYTNWLNIAFLLLAALLVLRFVRTGGIAMLQMMGGEPESARAGGHRERARATSPMLRREWITLRLASTSYPVSPDRRVSGRHLLPSQTHRPGVAVRAAAQFPSR